MRTSLARAFVAALLGTLGGIGTLVLGLVVCFVTKLSFENQWEHLIFVASFSFSMLVAAGIWGAVLSGTEFAAAAARATALALIAGFLSTGLLSLALKQVIAVPLSNESLWFAETLAGFIGGLSAGATWGWFLGGLRLAIRVGLTAASAVTAICIFPLTPILLLYFQTALLAIAYLPFLLCGTLLARPSVSAWSAKR